MPSSVKQSHGQYFTRSELLQQFVFDKVKHKGQLLLEPSVGAGHLLIKFKQYDQNYPMMCYEIDETIKPVIEFNKYQTLIYGDFTKQVIPKKFKTIVGNPPYIRSSKNNVYLKFIELCVEYLTDDGEMIFIVPSDFIKLTSATRIINHMLDIGRFTDFLFPHDETLFDHANIDVMVFRYERGSIQDSTVNVNGNDMFCVSINGIITFSDHDISSHTVNSRICDYFNVYVGLVSGRDEVFKVYFGNIEVLVGQDKTERFVFVESFPTDDHQINTHLESNKECLLKRRIKKFSESNWYEWGAPRNISSIKFHWGKPCIYVKNITRSNQIAFIGTVQYFSGTLLCLVPKLSMSDDTLQHIIDYMNSPAFKINYTYAGRFKIGHKQVSNAIIPL